VRRIGRSFGRSGLSDMSLKLLLERLLSSKAKRKSIQEGDLMRTSMRQIVLGLGLAEGFPNSPTAKVSLSSRVHPSSAKNTGQPSSSD